MRSPGPNTGSLRIHQPADVGLRGGLTFLSLSVFFCQDGVVIGNRQVLADKRPSTTGRKPST